VRQRVGKLRHSLMTRVLLIGKDGRSDCVAEALQRSGAEIHALCDFAHPGLRRRSVGLRIAPTHDVAAVVAFAREVKPDLVFVGPEDPLAAGVVDALQAALGVPCVGPTRELARIESSKSFARELVARHGIPGNPEHRVFREDAGLRAYLEALGGFVIKPDGLTGGKGVKVFGDHLHSIDEGLAYAVELLRAGPVVVEEKLDGEEFSFQSFTDGETVVDSVPVQDHKRALEGDRGPNTGGMGSYSCEDHLLPFLRAEHIEAARGINAAVVRALGAETGRPYRGILYGGFMVTAGGVRLIEYNARLGDPEAMNVLPLLETDFLALCLGVAGGHLARVPVSFRRQATVCKYLVPEGYPERPLRNVPVEVPDGEPWAAEGARMYYAAVRESGGQVVLSGSRAFAFVAAASTVSAAAAIVDRALPTIRGPLIHRRDIGSAELLDKRVQHLRRLGV
jgi:phosphoribosylamine---glycine ligase